MCANDEYKNNLCYSHGNNTGVNGDTDKIRVSEVVVLDVVVSVVSVMVVANSDRGVCMASALIFHPQSLQNRDVHLDKKCRFLLMIP